MTIWTHFFNIVVFIPEIKESYLIMYEGDEYYLYENVPWDCISKQ